MILCSIWHSGCSGSICSRNRNACAHVYYDEWARSGRRRNGKECFAIFSRECVRDERIEKKAEQNWEYVFIFFKIYSTSPNIQTFSNRERATHSKMLRLNFFHSVGRRSKSISSIHSEQRRDVHRKQFLFQWIFLILSFVRSLSSRFELIFACEHFNTA